MRLNTAYVSATLKSKTQRGPRRTQSNILWREVDMLWNISVNVPIYLGTCQHISAYIDICWQMSKPTGISRHVVVGNKHCKYFSPNSVVAVWVLAVFQAPSGVEQRCRQYFWWPLSKIPTLTLELSRQNGHPITDPRCGVSISEAPKAYFSNVCSKNNTCCEN